MDWDDPDIMLVLTLHNLAEKYKCLPSEALVRGNTLDLYVLDVSTKWVKHQQDLSQANSGSASINPSLSVEQMQGMINRVKESNK